MWHLAYEWNFTIGFNNEEKKLQPFEIDIMLKIILEFKNFNDEKMLPNLESLIEAQSFLFYIQIQKPNKFFL